MNKLSLKQKLGLLGGGLIFAMIVIGIVGIYSARTMARSLNSVISNDLPMIRSLTLIDMVHDGVRGAAIQSVLGVTQKNTQHLKEAEDAINEHTKNVHDEFDLIRSLQLTDEEKAGLGKAEADMNVYLESAKNLLNDAKAGDEKKVNGDFDAFQNQFEALEKSLGQLGDHIQQEKKVFFDGSLKNAQKMEHASLAFLVISLVSGFVFFMAISRSLSKMLDEINEHLQQKSKKLFDSAGGLVDVSRNMSDTVTKESAAIQQSATAMEEIASMVKKTDEGAKQLTSVAEKSSQSAAEGQQSFKAIVDEMQALRGAIENVMIEVEANNKDITNIVSLVGEISDKTKVINDIVFQTKLLSFNASVEAARAGEQGKGFAVVAEEVGNLATMSGNASKEISTLLEQSVKKITDITEASNRKMSKLINTSQEKLKMSFEMLSNGTSQLDSIVQQVHEVRSMINEITSAISEQALGVQEVNQAISTLQNTTHESVTSSKQAQEIASILKSDSEELERVSGDLEDLLKGKAA